MERARPPFHAISGRGLPMRWQIVAFSSGAALLQLQAALPIFQWAWLIPVGAALLPLLPVVGMGRYWRSGLLLLLALAAGFFYAAWRADLRLADAVSTVWEGRNVELTGRVQGLPEMTPRGVRFVLAIDATGRHAGLPQTLMLNVLASGDMPLPVYQGGDCVSLEARVFRPHANLNPEGFDYTAWLLERGVRGTGVATKPALPSQACTDYWAASQGWLDALRDQIRTRLRVALGEAKYAGIVVALAVGDQNAIPDSQWTLFRTTGITHLVSISGLHVTLFSSLVFLLVQWGWRRVPALALRWPARRAAMLAGVMTASMYVALAGFGLPAQRTLFMLVAMALAMHSGQVSSPSRVLAAALAAVVLIDPWAALAPGFWLSFGAVAALLYAGQGRLAQDVSWRRWLKAQWAVSLALLPVLLLLFNEVSLVSPLANAFAIPLISLLAVPFVLAAAVMPWDMLSAWLAQAGHGVISLTLFGVEALAQLPHPVWHGHVGGGVQKSVILALACIGVVLLLLPRGFPRRWLGLLLFLPLLFPRQLVLKPGEVDMTVLDVGQGLAVVVRTSHRTWLYDTGPVYASGDTAGAKVVAPFLYAHGVTRLDGLVVSHDDNDHSGGARAVQQSHSPEWLLTSLAGLSSKALSLHGQAILAEAPVKQACQAGQVWNWDGVRFEVLHPPARQYANPHFADNDRSCVIRLVSPFGSVLFTGDGERLAELSLLELSDPALRSDVIVVPHHGSKSSSMPDLLARVRPKWALISVGHRNRYGHPAPEILAAYRRAGAQILRTDQDGALQLRLRAAGIHAAVARETQPRYWHER